MSSKWRSPDPYPRPPLFPSGILMDYTARFVDDISSYESCKNCGITIHFHETFGKLPLCCNCKAPLEETLEENFSFKLFLKKEEKFDQLQGFRKDLVEFGSTMLQDLDYDDLDEIDKRLNSFFDGKKVTIEYSQRRGEKFIHKIKKITKADVEEPPKKKMKTEYIKND